MCEHMSQKNKDYFQLNKKMIFTKFKMLFRLARDIYIKIPVLGQIFKWKTLFMQI